jgi:hypothetical protein
MEPARDFGGWVVRGVRAEKLTYGVGIIYNIIMRCESVSYNLTRKVHHEEATV